MKLAKLSLAAIMVAGLSTSSFAADSLADAFAKGKVEGAIQGYYWTRDNGSDDADIFTSGLDLSYETAKFYGFAFKATFQGTSSPWADKEGKDMFRGDEYGSGAVLSEAYLSYTMKNTKVMVGRMYLDTPLIASSSSRVTKEAFQGVAIINTDLPNTTLIAGYVNKFQSRTNGDGKIGQFERLDDDKSDAYTIAVINKSITGLTLTAAYLDHVDNAQVGYLEAAYAGKASNFTYGLAGQYYYSELEDEDDTNLFGVKATFGIGNFSFLAAYTKTDDANYVYSGLGNGADLAFAESPLNSDGYTPDTQSYKIGASYAFFKNANLGVSYTLNDDDSANQKRAYTAIEADYAFEGPLKGLSAAITYEDASKDVDGSEMWLNLNYKF